MIWNKSLINIDSRSLSDEAAETTVDIFTLYLVWFWIFNYFIQTIFHTFFYSNPLSRLFVIILIWIQFDAGFFIRGVGSIWFLDSHVWIYLLGFKIWWIPLVHWLISNLDVFWILWFKIVHYELSSLVHLKSKFIFFLLQLFLY